LTFDVNAFGAELTDIERNKLPIVVAFALNETMFLIKDAWPQEMQKVFDRPTPLTLNSVLYKKATKGNLVAEVFIRDEAFKGTPPSEYLFPEVAGGQRGIKPFEKRLNTLIRRASGSGQYVPGRGLALDSFGNVPASVLGKVLSQLGARFNAEQNETALRKGRRLKRQRRKGGGGSYFAIPLDRGKLKRGVVYERITTAHGSAVRAVLFPVSRTPTYAPRFKPAQISQILFNAHFPVEFARAMASILGKNI
jgi:hypothetical protein